MSPACWGELAGSDPDRGAVPSHLQLSFSGSGLREELRDRKSQWKPLKYVDANVKLKVTHTYAFSNLRTVEKCMRD